ncbi:hypothetical protein D9M68_888120 [compost metagenome]
MLHIEPGAAHRVRLAHLLAHGHDLARQRIAVAQRGDHVFAHRIEAPGQRHAAEHKARARHGLVFPGPGGVAAALLLVVGVGLEAGDQQA